MLKVYRYYHVDPNTTAIIDDKIFLGCLDLAVRNVRRIERLEYGFEYLKYLEFEIPMTDEYLELCRLENYITNDDGDFIIKEIEPIPNSLWMKVHCDPNLELWTGQIIETFDCFRQDARSAIESIIALIPGWTLDWQYGLATGSITIQRSLSSPITILTDYWYEIDRTLECSFDTKNKILHCWRYASQDDQLRNSNSIVAISNQTGLKKLYSTQSSYGFATSLLPLGDADLRIGTINNDDDYVHLTGWSEKPITAVYKTTSTVMEKLRKAGRNELSTLQPHIFNTLSICISKDLKVGQYVYVLDDITGLLIIERVVEFVYYYDNPSKSSAILTSQPDDYLWDEDEAEKEVRKAIRVLVNRINALEDT